MDAHKRRALPEGWEWKRLGEIVKVTSGYGFPEKYQGKTTGEIPFFKVMDNPNLF
jgi:type I restriction enzyme S subunit